MSFLISIFLNLHLHLHLHLYISKFKMTSIHFALALSERFHSFSGSGSGKEHKRNTNSLHDNIQFIKNIYKITPETGNIDYCNCNCVDFPEYIPSNTYKVHD